jgi:Trypsin-like peptidase domain
LRPQGDALMFRYMAAVPLLLAAMSAQNAPTTNKGRHLDIPAISRKANGSIVSIVMSDKDGHPLAQGSGFLVTKNGRVVTNYHVIKNGASAVIKLPDGAFFAIDGVLAFDKGHDVAVIKAHGGNFQTVALGDSDRLQVGEEVVAIGSPLSLESTVSNGIVSGIRSDDGRRLLQITAPISHGSSGGPLFNLAGEVVGITTAALVGGENLNFAVPIDDVKKLLALPAAQALVAFPNEPEAPAAVGQEAAAPADGSPSLEDAQQWMKDNIGVGAWSNQAMTWFADDGQIVKPSSGNFLCSYGCPPLYAVPVVGPAVNVRDGKPHDWRRVYRSYDLKFEGCSMTVDSFDDTSTWTGSTSTGTVANPWDAPEKVTFNGSQTFNLQHYDPRVNAQEDLTTEDMADSTYQNIVVPKGTEYINPTATLTARPLSHYNSDLPIFLSMSYPFAERFAKALQHAITLCGGKTESF